MKVLFTGGGTGGHIFPIISIVREIKRIELDSQYPLFKSSNKKGELEFFYVGPNDNYSIFLSQEGIKVKSILAGKIRRYLGVKSILQNLIDIVFKTPIGIIQAFFYIFFLAPDVVFSKGGYGSLPVVLASWILQIPIFLHESDVSPGLANRFISKFCIEIFVSLPISRTEYFPPKKMVPVGNPIRIELLRGSTDEAKKMFKLTLQKPIILILGGSQGSQRINDKVLEILPEILLNFELIHQCGEKNYKQVKAESEIVVSEKLKPYYHLFPFLKEQELKQAYYISDLVVSRAGSGSIFEIASVSKPSILIPLPESAQNHQVKNAYTYAENGSCLVIEEANFTAHFFLEKIKYLFSHPEQLEAMRKASKNFSRPDSAKVIAQYLIEYLSR